MAPERQGQNSPLEHPGERRQFGEQAANLKALRESDQRQLSEPRTTGASARSCAPLSVDLTQVPQVPWAWVDEHVYAAIRGCSVKVLQRERRLNIGCPFRRINGTTIRYKLGDITAFLESQPHGGGAERPTNHARSGRGRPRRIST